MTLPVIKRRNTSKKKGNRGELDVSKLLTVITGVLWHRVPCSGSLHTTGHQLDLRGDVYSVSPGYDNLVIEVKNYKYNVTLSDLFIPSSPLLRWISQLRSECVTCSDSVLFFKCKGKWLWYLYSDGHTRNNTHFISQLRSHSLTYHDYGMILDSTTLMGGYNALKHKLTYC